jgi:hypothetical protein
MFREGIVERVVAGPQGLPDFPQPRHSAHDVAGVGAARPDSRRLRRTRTCARWPSTKRPFLLGTSVKIYRIRRHVHRRYSIGCDQETKSPSQRPTGSRHRPARRPTFRSLQSHQSLPSRSYRRWYPWLQSNARALVNYTDHGGGAAGNARCPLVAFFQIRKFKICIEKEPRARYITKRSTRKRTLQAGLARRHEQHCLAAIEMLDH